MTTRRSMMFGRSTLTTSLVAMLCLVIGSSFAWGQRPRTPAKKREEAKPAAPAKNDENPRPDAGAKKNPEDQGEPQLVNLQTDDGVLISATYFPPFRPGKDVACVILMHGYGEKESIFFPTKTGKDLAFALQDRGYAVLTFDFRGHGHSTRRVSTAQADTRGGSNKLDFTDLRSPTHFAPLLNDIETVKRFLVQRNNAGEINIGKLGVVGSEMGASLATVWAFRDWQYPVQAGFSGKQGQDVQALVLVSPQYNYKGIAITNELGFMQKRVPIQVVVGRKDDRAFNDAKKIYQTSARARPSETDSRLTELNTKVQGGQLLNPDLELDVAKEIADFLDATVKRKGSAWEAREGAGDGNTGS